MYLLLGLGLHAEAVTKLPLTVILTYSMVIQQKIKQIAKLYHSTFLTGFSCHTDFKRMKQWLSNNGIKI